MIKALGNELEQGKNLSSFLEKRKFFSPAHLATLKAGEASGKVSEALVRISADLKRDHQMIKKIKGAMAYPLIITLALTGVTVFIVVFVLPKVGDVFKQMNLDIPLPTRILLALGSFLSHYYLYVIAGLGIAGLVLFSLSKTNVLSFKIFSQIVCYLPILKKLVYQVGMARFIRSLSSLLNSGVSIGDSLSISGEIFVSNKRKKIIKSVGEKVRGGVSLTEAFKTHQGSFGGMLVKMCSVGEKSGRLAEILEELAVFYEEEVQEKLDNFSTIIEPVLMLFVGVGVGAMILSIVGPIYQMMGSLTP
jgi:type IV pilus assembly protein PilC